MPLPVCAEQASWSYRLSLQAWELSGAQLTLSTVQLLHERSALPRCSRPCRLPSSCAICLNFLCRVAWKRMRRQVAPEHCLGECSASTWAPGLRPQQRSHSGNLLPSLKGLQQPSLFPSLVPHDFQGHGRGLEALEKWYLFLPCFSSHPLKPGFVCKKGDGRKGHPE